MFINYIREKDNSSKGDVEYFSSISGIFLSAKKYPFKDIKEVFDKYNNNNEKSKRIIDQAIEGLAKLIFVLVVLINPLKWVFYGSVAIKNKWYIEKAAILAKTRMYEDKAKSFKWHISNLKDVAILKGAIFLFEKFDKENNGYNLKPKILIKDIDFNYLRKNIFSKGMNLIET